MYKNEYYASYIGKEAYFRLDRELTLNRVINAYPRSKCR